MSRVLTRTLSLLLLLEALNTVLWIAGLLESLPTRGPLVLSLLGLRAATGALQMVGGALLVGRRPPGPGLATIALLASAVLTTCEIGLRMAPSNLDPTFRWWVVWGYWIYAAAAIILLRAARSG